ncbi:MULTISPECIES: hypothetical protein [Helicobacter]|uniref:Uncharacterized protein n=1 Tax=Helicobacter bilis ATCC 43879 TaxID=613026 RepID=T5LQ22_9HELI|nr:MULTISPECIES: hypothetical protein [Helicobacter]EQM94772.1 hypothetical protein HRAG_02518 [Helicobacter bilis ATCC 43879]
MISLKTGIFPGKNSNSTPTETPSRNEDYTRGLSKEEMQILLRKKGFRENILPVDPLLFISRISDEDIEEIKSRRV